MTTIKLTQEELDKIKTLITKYAGLGIDLEKIEKGILELLEKENKIRDELTKTRNEEFKFSEYIKQKYGDGTLNLQTFEYELKNSE